jgi:hypothetical protein
MSQKSQSSSRSQLKQQIITAQKLVREKQYDEARNLLKNMRHRVARDLLQKVDEAEWHATQALSPIAAPGSSGKTTKSVAKTGSQEAAAAALGPAATNAPEGQSVQLDNDQQTGIIILDKFLNRFGIRVSSLPQAPAANLPTNSIVSFAKSYWPALAWFVASTLGVLGILSYVFPPLAPFFGFWVLLVPVSFIRTVQMRALIRFRFIWFTTRNTWQRGNTIYYQDRPGCLDDIFNFIQNGFLTLFIMPFIYPFWESIAQGSFLIKAVAAFRVGRTMPTRAALWGRARRS